jgi:6,7-dimethyl-8-ribityllumazine synthase
MTKYYLKRKIFALGVVAEWNEEITEGLYNGAEAAFLDNEVPAEHIIRWNVPGVLSLFMVRKNATNAKCRCNNRNWMCDTRRNKTF